MGFLDRFSKKKKKEETLGKKEVSREKEREKTDLGIICADDPEAYEALYDTMALDPRGSRTSMEEAVAKAEALEKTGDITGACAFFEIAGAKAIYEGNVKKVKKYFEKCAELKPDREWKILEIPDRAVKKAQEYYAKYLVEEPAETEGSKVSP